MDIMNENERIVARAHARGAEMMRRRYGQKRLDFTQSTDSIIHLWALRILVSAGGHRAFIRADGFSDDDIAETIGLEKYVDRLGNDSEKFESRQALRALRSLHATVENKYRLSAALPSILDGNVTCIAELVGLNEVERQILAFVLLLNRETLLENVGDILGELSTNKLIQVLSVILDLSQEDIKQSLSPKGRLEQSGLIRINRNGNYDLKGKLDVLSDQFVDRMLGEENDPVALVQDTIFRSRSPELNFDDFLHLGKHLAILRPYMQAALQIKKLGVNILCYGPPGTGKSELARIIAQDLESELFEIASADDDGDPKGDGSRLLSFRAAQSFLSQRRALLVFDEVEDIFGDGNPFIQKSRAQSSKAWMNRMLEENAIPVIWISNSINGIDPAFIRRFDIVMEVPIPPQSQRKKILIKAADNLLDSESLKRISSSESVAPGVATRALSVVKTIQDHLPPDGFSRAVETLVSNTLVAQGSAPLNRNISGLPDYYDPGYVNADSDLNALAEGLSKRMEGRICLFGPPGTGKTAFGNWLAKTLGMPLQVKKASDLLNEYVGGTEKRIARAFRAAEQDNAVLLIDEVDSFLRDRRGAQRSWEVTNVNEMLTQMESYKGIFIASTNLMDGIDQAALRRFDLKICFGYLRPEQAWQLFLCQCDQLCLGKASAKVKKEISSMNLLTPGDFAAVRRQHQFKPISSQEFLLEALRAECVLKEGHRNKSFGFM